MNIKAAAAYSINALFAFIFISLTGCSNLPQLPPSTLYQPVTKDAKYYNYLIGPGDTLNIFVWRNSEVSTEVTVRPDGKITIPLVEDMPVSGKTPAQLGRDIEKVLSAYIKDPVVTITLTNFVGPYNEQIRIIGEAVQPQALPYREKMTLLDVMIIVGGLTEFAAGNQASIVRIERGKQKKYNVRIEDLIRDGDMTANTDVLPGDIIIIPEAWF